MNEITNGWRGGDPATGWHDNDVFSVSYDDIEVLIDRIIDGEIEIRVWRNGKNEDYPYALLKFQIGEPKDDEDDDDGCPLNDPDCMGSNEDRHDECEENFDVKIPS